MYLTFPTFCMLSIAGCGRRGDVIFVLDASGSVEENFDLSLQLTRKIVEGLNFAGGRTRVGVVTYSDMANVRFHLNQYQDKQSVQNAIAFTLQGGRTNTADGISTMSHDMFTSSKGDRVGDNNFAIVITDGLSNIQPDKTIDRADEARQAGIKMVAVGVGHNGNVDRREINDIADQPENLHTMFVESQSDIDTAANKILDLICQ